MVNKICIVGMGLIGGSIGLAVKHRGLARSVIGYDESPHAARTAERLGAVDRYFEDIKEAVDGADLVLLCTPVDVFEALAVLMAPALRPGAIVSDVGSTKGEVARKMAGALPEDVHYVGGHPMAGSEKGGINAADVYLFENAVYVITPLEKTDAAAVEKVSHLARGLGSRVILLTPEEHDLVVAAVSHVPHIVASALVITLMDVAVSQPAAPSLASGGFRDTTRVAAGDPELWRQICFSNRGQIKKVMAILQRNIRRFQGYLESGSEESFRDSMDKAREMRLEIPSGLKGILPGFYELVVTVPDKPGIIGMLGTILGDAGVNIMDIEILRVREGEGGTIRLGFIGNESREKAAAVLGKNNIPLRRL